MSIRYPMEHGIVKDWNDMERIWQYIYSKDQLHTFSEEVQHFRDNKFNFAFLTIRPENMAMIFCM